MHYAQKYCLFLVVRTTYFKQPHIKEKLQKGKNWQVKVNFHRHSHTSHSFNLLAYSYSIKFLTADHSEDKI